MVNQLFQDDKDFIEEVSGDFEKYITRWILGFKNGEYTKDDIIKITKKVADYRNDENLVAEVEQRFLTIK